LFVYTLCGRPLTTLPASGATGFLAVMATLAVCLVVPAAVLRPGGPAAVLRPGGMPSPARTSKLLAGGWVTGVDEASGATYYYNEATGKSQWGPPKVVWRVAPGHWDEPPAGHWGGSKQSTGVASEYALRNGQTQVLGRYDMIEQSLYVSRAQCAVQVDADGTATLVSLGKSPTVLRGRVGGSRYPSPWFGLRKEKPHVLISGEEIGLEWAKPEAAFFTISCEEDSADAGGYEQHYSDDGEWMWNGSEWIAIR